MEYKTVIDHRKNALFTELQEARAKMLAAIRDARVKRQRVNEIHAQLAELHRIETIKSQSDEEEADSIDSETGARVSSAILQILAQCHPHGAALSQLGEALPQVKKSTISATLYNMKKRGEIEHIESTGRYQLSAKIRANLTRAVPR